MHDTRILFEKSLSKAKVPVNKVKAIGNPSLCAEQMPTLSPDSQLREN
jgi:hypothetical protein